jgi:hypothetical protein
MMCGCVCQLYLALDTSSFSYSRKSSKSDSDTFSTIGDWLSKLESSNPVVLSSEVSTLLFLQNVFGPI